MILDKRKYMVAAIGAALLGGCSAPQYEFDTDFHITKERVADEAPKPNRNVPDLVGTTAELPELSQQTGGELFDVVYDGSVRELLLRLSDQAALNLDIDTGVDGYIQISAYDQTIGQILERLKKQLPIRYETIGDTLIILNDESYVKQYHLSFPDLTRSYSSSVDGSTPTSGSGSLGSAAIGISKDGTGSVWQDLEAAIGVVIAGLTNQAASSLNRGPYSLEATATEEREELTQLAERTSLGTAADAFVHTMPDIGLIIFYGNAEQHELVSAIIARIESSSKRQVLLQATVVEIALNNKFQQGIDWSVFNATGRSLKATQSQRVKNGSVIGGVTQAQLESLKSRLELIYPTDEGEVGAAAAAANRLLIQNYLVQESNIRQPFTSQTGFLNFNFGVGDLDAAISLLDQFGDARVVSSPRISTLNGQPAILKVVEDNIYFNTEITRDEADDGTVTETVSVNQNVIPVGFVVNVYPQISADDTIILSMRPSISRVTGTVQPPTVGTVSSSPVPIVSVKEIETLLLLQDGQTSVMGGLIEDQIIDSSTNVPGAADIAGIGDLFKNKDQQTRRVEYVIFVSAKIVSNPSIYGDYSDFQDLLPSDETMRRDTSGSLLTRPGVRVPRTVE